MATTMEHQEYAVTAHEANTIYAEVLPLANELSVLSEDASSIRETFYGEKGIYYTELQPMQHNTVKSGATVLVKDECLQRIGSYKGRGAIAATMAASPATRLVAFSAGNHAQGVLQAAVICGAKEVVVTTFRGISPAKEKRILEGEFTKSLKVTLDKEHSGLEEAGDAAILFAGEPDTALIPPFDAHETMAGQSTMMSEIIWDLLEKHARNELNILSDRMDIVVPAGGGGAAAGMAIMLRYLKDAGVVGENVRLLVAQMQGADAIVAAKEGRALGEVDPSCDGTNVREPGKLTTTILQDERFVAEMHSVPKFYVGRAMLKLEKQLGHPVEPAGCLSLALILYLEENNLAEDGQQPLYVSLVSGGNRTDETYAHFVTPEVMVDAYHETCEQYALRPTDLAVELGDIALNTAASGSNMLSGPTALYRTGLVVPAKKKQSA